MPHTKWSRAIVIAVGAAALVTLVLIAFIWPSLTSSVRNLPLAVVGTSAQVSSVTKELDSKLDGGFVVTKIDSRADAVRRIKTRDELGAIVLGDSPEVLVASAGGTAVSQLLTQLAGQLQAQANAVAAGHAPPGTTAPTITVTVTDVVPLVSADSRGVGLTAAAFPLTLGGMLGGIAISLLIVGVWRRLAGVIVYSIIAGVGVVSVMQGWFGVLEGSFLANTAAVSLAMAATGAFIVGANALIGTAGIPLGSVVTMLIGNPLSSASAPVQFMAQPWGQVGQYFVPGASATLIRDLSYFPSADATMPWLVLTAWTVLGIVAMVAGHFRNQEVVHLPALEEQPV